MSFWEFFNLRVSDLMAREVVRITKDTSLEKAIKKMYEKRVGSVIIADEKGKCEGIFTTTDVLRIIVKKIPLESSIQKVMSKKIITVSEKSSFSKARELMKRHRIRHLPVIDGKGCVIGILSIRSILDEISGLKKSAW